jgi:hypothetical protein
MLPVTEYAYNSWTYDKTWKMPHYLLIGHTPQVNIQLIEEHVSAATN